MAIGRLLLSPKLTPPWTHKGSVPLTRRLFSSSMEDGRKHESLSESNKEISQKGMHWYSLGGILTHLKQTISGKFNIASGQDSISPKATNVVPDTKVVSLHNVSENKSFISQSVKEEPLVSEMVSQDASQSVSRADTTYVEKETISENKSFISQSIKDESLVSIMVSQDTSQSVSKSDTHSLVTSEFAKEEVLRLIQSSKDVSLENQGKLKPHKKKQSQKKLSNMFIDMFPDKEDKLHHKPLSNNNNQQGQFGKMLSDHIRKMENDKETFSDSPQSPKESLSSFLLSNTSLEEKRENKSSNKADVPLEVSRDLGMKNLMDSLHCPEEYNDTKIEEESKEEEALCTHASLASTTATSLASLSIGEEEEEEDRSNTVMLRFLKETAEKSFIVQAFSQFGDVKEVQEIPSSSQGCIYKDALVTFKTNLGAKKALNNAYMMVSNQNVVTEATCEEDIVEKISIPDLIGDPEVPIALVKEPNRTVKIHPLASDINLSEIKEALSFCRSEISKLIFGSSKESVFVEFKTEDGKERALEAHSFSICNKRCFVYRIDTPRTTVVRISNLSELSMRDIRKLCSSYGKIKQVVVRGLGVADLYFDVSEWPKMVSILNSLNGKEMDGMKWVARPAFSVIPPVILKALWEDPQGKRCVKRMIQNLVREIEKPLETSLSYTLVADLVQ